MAATAFFGYLLLGTGPGLVFFLFFIAPKSFIVLLSLFSAFYWLLVLLLTCAVFRGFVPITVTPGAYAGALLASVAVEEAARVGVWYIHRVSCVALASQAAGRHHVFTPLDRLHLALGWGYGHGAMHVVLFFLSLLPLTTGSGTWYNQLCPAMNLFLVQALNSLAFGASLAALMLVALEGWAARAWHWVGYVPAMHAAMALVTIGSMHYNGCIMSTAAQLALGVVNVVVAGRIAWRKLKP